MFIEIVLNTTLDPLYCGSFFFYLAIVCKVTMFIDIPIIKNFVFLGGGKDVAKAGKASRLGAKASKVVRVIRLIRLIRVAKLYKQQKGEEEEEDILLFKNDKDFDLDKTTKVQILKKVEKGIKGFR
jgi:hypothetical protein